MRLKLETDLDDNIEEVASTMVDIAWQLGVTVVANLEGVPLTARFQDDSTDVVQQYKDWWKK